MRQMQFEHCWVLSLACSILGGGCEVVTKDPPTRDAGFDGAEVPDAVGDATQSSPDGGSCQPGWGDCTAAPGCETDLLASATNCGKCGHDCLGVSCGMALCEPTQLGTAQVGVFGQSIGVHGQTVYWITGDTIQGALWTCPTSGCPAMLAALNPTSGHPWASVLDSRQVFWLDKLGVLSCPLTGCGSGPTRLSPEEPVSGGIAIDAASHVYWTDTNNKVVKKYDNSLLPGTEIVQLSTTSSLPTSIAVDGSTVYWLEVSSSSMDPIPPDGRLMRCSTACTNNAMTFVIDQRLHAESWFAVNELTVANSNVYWIAATGLTSPLSRVMTCPTTGCGDHPSPFGDVDTRAPGLYSDGTYLYWATKDLQFNIARRRLDGTGPAEKFATTIGPVSAITSDATYIYWIESSGLGAGPLYLMKAPR